MAQCLVFEAILKVKKFKAGTFLVLKYSFGGPLNSEKFNFSEGKNFFLKTSPKEVYRIWNLLTIGMIGPTLSIGNLKKLNLLNSICFNLLKLLLTLFFVKKCWCFDYFSSSSDATQNYILRPKRPKLWILDLKVGL